MFNSGTRQDTENKYLSFIIQQKSHSVVIKWLYYLFKNFCETILFQVFQ